MCNLAIPGPRKTPPASSPNLCRYMDILAIRGPLQNNGYGIMGNLAIPGPLVKLLPRPVQIYAHI